MFIGEKLISNNTWKPLTEVNTGDYFYIQNTSNYRLRYCVSENAPVENVQGNILESLWQMDFQKVKGNLYVKKINGDAFVAIEIAEKVEG